MMKIHAGNVNFRCLHFLFYYHKNIVKYVLNTLGSCFNNKLEQGDIVSEANYVQIEIVTIVCLHGCGYNFVWHEAGH